jgi:uncharacterized damage-inducible protein DinB
MKPYLEQLMDYNYWANGLILKYGEKLPSEQFVEETSHSQSSLRDILSHVLFAEWIWLDRMQGKTMPLDEMRKIFIPDKYSDIKSLYEDWFDLELRMRDFMAELPATDYKQEFSYTRSDGTDLNDTYADIFTQLVLHGMQHRAECALILTGLGHSPGNLDYLTYLRP